MPRILSAIACCVAVAAHGATVRTTPVDCDGTIHAVAGETRLSVPLHGEAQLTLAASKQWRITLESDDCWAPPAIAMSDSITLPAWRKRVLSGEFAVAPQMVTIAFRSPDSVSGGVPPSEVACSVDGKRWTCGVPRALLDVRIDVPGFAPARLWNVEAADVGRIELHPGASVAGFVTRDDRGPLEEAVVELLSDDKLVQRLRSNARGFFQFTSVPEGTYTIAARRPKGAPTRERGVRVVKERETTLRRPLLLAGFAKLHATLRPPVTPASHPWTVALYLVDFARHAWLPLSRGSATAGGIWERGDLERETYNVEVADELGAIYFRQYVEIDADVKEINVALSTLPVEGRIRLGASPIHASVVFEADDASVMMESDDDGNFYGSLPHEGRYEIRVRPKGERFQEIRRSADVRRSSADGVASVEIDLPSGRIKGTAVNGSGKPLAQAVIMAWRGTTPIGTTFSDETGAFEVAGLDAGTVTLIGSAGKNRSVPYSYEIAAEPSPATIVINDARIVRGRVLSSGGGGIAGAELRYNDGMFAGGTVSGPGGEYSFRLNSMSDVVTVVVVTPGFPVKLTKLRIPEPGETADIVISNVGGVLSVIPSAGWPVLFHDGCVMSLSRLLLPRTGPGPPPEMQGNRFVIQVEPGEYTVCPAAILNEQCARRVVPPRGEVLVDMRSR